MSRILRWGLIGGGEGSQIGPLHRIASAVDGRFKLTAGALDISPERGRAFARDLGIAPERAYGDWRDMLNAESGRDDERLDLVTVATPNATHYAITGGFLDAGFHVLCEKPLTQTLAEAQDIVARAAAAERICAVNYGYSGYPLVRHMRAMVRRGDLGQVRLVVAEFAHGFHADASEADNPRLRWRYDPAEAGASAVFADAGIHALHLACFVTGEQPTELSADFVSNIAGRDLEDDASINLRLDGGATCRLWTSAIAVGRMHGLTLQVFGEKAGVRWAQEQPNQLYLTPLNGQTTIVERGTAGLSPEGDHASRITLGHAEGIDLAFANIYRDLADAIEARDGTMPAYPTAQDGYVSMAAIEAAVASAAQGGAWTPVVPLPT